MPNAIEKDLNAAFLKGLIRAQQLIRREAPIRSGDLRRATAFSPPELTSEGLTSFLGVFPSQIGSDINYGGYVVFGTGIYGPHKQEFTIRAKEKKALSFTSGGVHYLRKSVTIKGIKPNNYFQTGYEKGKAEIGGIIRKDMKSKIVAQLKSEVKSA